MDQSIRRLDEILLIPRPDVAYPNDSLLIPGLIPDQFPVLVNRFLWSTLVSSSV